MFHYKLNLKLNLGYFLTGSPGTIIDVEIGGNSSEKGMTCMKEYDVIIIGAGPAGMTAGIYAVRAGMRVLMLDKLSYGGQIINTNEIQNYTGFGSINGADLAYKMYTHTQEMGVEFDYRTVVKIEDAGERKLVYCEEDDAVFSAKSLIIATGTRPRCLGVPGEERFRGNGVSWCAICDGAQYRDRDVVVIGGGNSAVQESIYLAGTVKFLTIVTMLDLTADPLACDRLRSFANVKIYPWQEVIEFTGDKKLEGVRFKSAKTGQEQFVECEGIFEYIGLKPTTEFLKGSSVLDDQAYVKVNQEMETSIPGIYAAGDCIEKSLRQVITACGDGAVAAQNASRYVLR
ncbi:NAD(P)/FAD-dependent oxidoreductase [Murimonas intestini]|uniref:NAD(P)/FAD-dependent oxidoreductase n=1 Tax=Murimonas intestini TaxID=1337051 RepID=UPI001FAAC91D|nr:FAD-dependent oxidoreductase [Murimonas intestini]